jgi:hypothetical protein
MALRSMLCLSVAAAVAVPLYAQAQEFTPIGDRILSDPTYLPLQGQIYGQSGYDYQRINSAFFDSTGAETAAGRNNLNTFHQSFAYGISDALSVNFGIAYGFGSDTNTKSTTVTSTNRNGFEDPTFGLTYRVFDQRTHPLGLDIFGDYSPDVIASRAASPTQDATIARGGPEADFGIALGRETRAFTVRGAFTGRYFGASSTQESLSGATMDTASYWVPSLSVQTQTRFSPRLSANVGFEYNFQGSPSVTDTGSGVTHINKIGDTQDVNVSLNYHIIPNRLVGSVGYQHTFFDDRNEIFADPTDNTLLTRSGNTYSATLRYVFH